MCTLARGVDTDPTIFWTTNFAVGAIYRNQFYEFRSIVVVRDHFATIESVDQTTQHHLYDLAVQVGVALKITTSAARINYALLGNRIQHVHWHIVPRHRDDHLWGKAPWPHPDQAAPSDDVLVERACRLADVLSDMNVPGHRPSALPHERLESHDTS